MMNDKNKLANLDSEGLGQPLLWKNKVFRVSLFVVFLSVMLSSCSYKYTSTVIALSPIQYPRTDSDTLAIMATQIPTTPYIEIALLQVPIYRSNNNSTTNLRRLAADHGADAVINLRINDSTVSGVAIRWKR